jgi:hypothetical protein
MKKVLAITVALMIAVIVIMPALGYTNQAAGNQSYTAKSGDKPDYSFTTKAPAHNLTSAVQVNNYSFKSTAIQSTRVAYSFKLLGVENAVAQGMKTKKPVLKLGSISKMEEAAPVAAQMNETAAAPVAAQMNETLAAPVAAQMNETVSAPANATAFGNATVAINATK